MNDYISRKALLDWVHEFYPEDKVFASAIINAPAADVAPVVHSRWEITDIEHAYGIKCYYCPECGEDEWRDNEPNYCPNCGAKMDGDDVV